MQSEVHKMTEKEAINDLNFFAEKLHNGIFGDRTECFTVAVTALEEVQQYRTLLKNILMQLENIKTDCSCNRCVFMDSSDSKCALITKNLAIDIVKSSISEFNVLKN